jgi:hypothetical protein
MMTYHFKEKKMSLAAKGREFLEKNPEAKASDLVKHCKFGIFYARSFVSAHRRKLIDKEFVDQFKTEVPPEPNWHERFKGAVMHINSLEKQIIGYKAVIDYLEHQLAAAADRGSSV